MRVKLVRARLVSVDNAQTSGLFGTSTIIHSELQIVNHDLALPGGTAVSNASTCAASCGDVLPVDALFAMCVRSARDW